MLWSTTSQQVVQTHEFWDFYIFTHKNKFQWISIPVLDDDEKWIWEKFHNLQEVNHDLDFDFYEILLLFNESQQMKREGEMERFHQRSMSILVNIKYRRVSRCVINVSGINFSFLIWLLRCTHNHTLTRKIWLLRTLFKYENYSNLFFFFIRFVFFFSCFFY